MKREINKNTGIILYIKNEPETNGFILKTAVEKYLADQTLYQDNWAFQNPKSLLILL